jgi:hypothetical protein
MHAYPDPNTHQYDDVNVDGDYDDVTVITSGIPAVDFVPMMPSRCCTTEEVLVKISFLSVL